MSEFEGSAHPSNEAITQGEQKQNFPKVGEVSHGFSSSQPEQPRPQQEITANTNQPRAIFENCIVGGLMPSVKQVEKRLAEGRITEEQAAVEKKRALRTEQHYMLGDRIVAIQNMFDGGDLPAEEKRSLRAEYKNLKKELRRIRREDD